MAGILHLVLNYSWLGFPLLHIQLSISTQYILWYFTIKGFDLIIFGAFCNTSLNLWPPNICSMRNHRQLEAGFSLSSMSVLPMIMCTCVHTYWWTWGWRSGWQQPTRLCGQEYVSPEPPGSHHKECPEEKHKTKIRKHQDVEWLTHIVHTIPPMSCCFAFSHSHTCFLRLFITPMMLDSCLYSSLVAHFLSLFFLELEAFSGEATPVMSARLM